MQDKRYKEIVLKIKIKRNNCIHDTYSIYSKFCREAKVSHIRFFFKLYCNYLLDQVSSINFK